MTVAEYDEKFDDEHQVNFRAVAELDDERRAANIANQTWEEQRNILGIRMR